MAAIVVQDSVVGDQSSAGRTALDEAMPSRVVPPPTASTEPSGSIVSVWNARGNVIWGVERHVGDGAVMSRTYVVRAAGAVDTPTSAALPDFMTLPGWYMTAL